jgi:5-methyltetrahydrofolate--homocysteine methyltransferase
MADYSDLQAAMITCDTEKVLALVQQALDAGNDAKAVLDRGLIAGMDVIGDRMESGEMFIPEVLMAAKAMESAVEMLKPLLGEDESIAAGKVIIGTVKGDLHDIGKNLVAMMMASVGLEVINLGVDIGPEQFVAAVKENAADILCLSALLTTTMPAMKETIDAVAAEGLRETLKIMVGGAPVTQAFADEIGADGFAPDAGSAAKAVKSYLAR